jgi:hypothetical protein
MQHSSMRALLLCAVQVRRILLAALCVLASAPVAGQQPGAAAGAPAEDAYGDDVARELVRQARIRRGTVDSRIRAYETQAHERMSARLGTGIGERLLFRRETASRISWTPDSVHVHVLGAREVLPFVRAAPQIPQDLSGYMPSLAFDPVESDMLLRLERSSLRHPLAAGSEAHYRFAAGDSTVITLSDGRRVRLRELRIVPRRSDPQLLTGSFWLDVESHAVVQAYFRLARGYDSRRDGGSRIVPLTAELEYIAIDYGLWDLRWWLPRTIAAHGVMQVAGMRLPISYERRYGDYSVTGDTVAVPPHALADTARLCRPRVSMAIVAQPGTSPLDTMSATTAARLEAQRDSTRRERRIERGDTTAVCERRFVVTREDHPDLLTSELLPDDIYAGDASIIDEAELRAIAERVGLIPSPPWQLARPSFQWPLNRPGLLRYNRVEGLSVAARAGLDLGRVSLGAGARVGTAAGEWGAELDADRSGTRVRAAAAAYRRLDVVDVASDPFGLRSSLAALLAARDDNDYFRATGAELRIAPPAVRTQWYEIRLFAERQAPLATRSDFSVARVFDAGRDMRPNIAADAADQFGAMLRLRTSRGLDPAAFRWAAEAVLHGETGDFDFARPSLRLRANAPAVGRISLGGELAGGSSFGDTPAQRLWQVGGAGTLRGFDAAALRGEAFWTGRAELGYGLEFARFITFTDAGWAGPRNELQRSRALTSLGVGASLLDGMLRLDAARARQTGTWKAHLYFNGVL